ncbi:ABC transporter permease [Hamadaea sp. NPDC051192]|uniref:ABC transporter permease n=1 Tax=Hamadaea sp. NPDC051192 TaxID=3154940 RepID=UPI00344223AE
MSEQDPPVEPGGDAASEPETGGGQAFPVNPTPVPSAAQAEALAGQPVAPTKKGGKPSLGQAFLKELWADNSFTVTLLAIVLAGVVAAVLMVLGDENTRQQWAYFFYQPGTTLQATWDLLSVSFGNLFKGSIVDPDTFSRWVYGMDGVTWQRVLYPISETLTAAAPLIFTGLAVALPFRAGLFNIGGQGQAIMGALAGGTAGFALGWSSPFGWIAATIAGALAGFLYGGLVGLLKARTGAHEVILTIMLNYVALYFMSWYIIQPWVKNPERSDAISKPIPPDSMYPKIFGTTASDTGLRANLAIVLAILAAWAISWLLRRGTFGFELRAVGYNPDAAKTAGMKVGATLALTMAISGALAGLGGTSIAVGTAGALTVDMMGQVGFNGILVALLGRVKPWGVVAAGLLYGALTAGGSKMQTGGVATHADGTTVNIPGISNEIVGVIQALIVIFVAAPLLVRAIFKLRRSPSAAATVGLAKG